MWFGLFIACGLFCQLLSDCTQSAITLRRSLTNKLLMFCYFWYKRNHFRTGGGWGWTRLFFLARDYEDQETTHKHLAAEGRNRYVYNIFTVPWDFMNIRALIELLPPSYLLVAQTVQASDSIKVSTCWRPRVPVVPCSNPTRTEIIVLIDISLPGVVWRIKKVRRWRVLDCS